MGIAVEQVASGAGLRQFIRFPLALYAGDPCYVPHLLSERKRFFSPANPLFEFTEVGYLLARDEAGEVVGRVTAHINRRHNEFWGERTGFFGFFESVQRLEVAQALLTAAEHWLKERGMGLVRGPLNFSTNEECGFLVEGFDKLPVFMMPYTKPYYLDFMGQLGYAKAKDLLAYSYAHTGEIPRRLSEFAERAARRAEATVRTMRMEAFEDEVRTAFSIYNQAWAQNWGFVPMTEAEFAYMARELRPVVDPSIALFAEVAGEPVGFSLGIPDYNPILKRMNGRLFPVGFLLFLLGRHRIRAIRVLTLGVLKEHRKRGLDALLIYWTFANGLAKGYRWGEFSWVLEDNVLLRRALERFGAVPYKTYRIFEKAL